MIISIRARVWVRPTTQPLVPSYHLTRTLACPRKPNDVVCPAYEMISDLPSFLRYLVCQYVYIVYCSSCYTLSQSTGEQYHVSNHIAVFYCLSIADSWLTDCIVRFRFDMVGELSTCCYNFTIFYVSI